MACPPLEKTLTDITEILESSALDWMIDVKNNSGHPCPNSSWRSIE